MKAYHVVPILTVMAGCVARAPRSTLPPPGGSAIASATIPLGGFATLDGITIRPIEVVEDSRCPINARCVWEGRLVVRVERQKRGPVYHDMELGKPLRLAGATLTLVHAEPQPTTAKPAPASYLLTFTLER